MFQLNDAAFSLSPWEAPAAVFTANHRDSFCSGGSIALVPASHALLSSLLPHRWGDESGMGST